jgi:hypothetical protein
LAGRLARAIDVEDEEVVPLSVPQSSWLLLFHEGASEQILEKEGSQGLNWGLIKRGEKATERRTCRQAISSKECHERAYPGLDPLVKGFQRPFATDCIAEEHGEKIDHFVTPEAEVAKAHLLFNGGKHAMAV